MAHQAKGRALWNRKNTQEQGLVIDHPRYADILNNKRPGLTKIVQPSYLWNHLRKYGVLDKEIQDEITKPTRQQTVEQLLDHVECGPCWRLHAFLRACSLEKQEHVVSHIGLSADTYSGPSPPESDTEDAAPAAAAPPPGGSTQEPPLKKQRIHHSTTATVGSANLPPSPSASTMTEPHTRANLQSESLTSTSWSHQQQRTEKTLREALAVHYQYYIETLMVAKVFDFKHHDPMSDIYNLDECHIQLDAEVQKYKRRSQPIKITDILSPFGASRAPRNVLLVGPAGAGKSTFLKRFAYLHSQNFLKYHQGLAACPRLMTVVYVPVRSLTSDIWGSIEREVCCQEKDRKYIVDQVRVDSESSVLLDGIDEVRNAETLQAIQTFIDLNHKYAGPRILVAARTGLSQLTNSSFDRFLSIEGFTIDQGLEYTHKYISIHNQVDITLDTDLQNKQQQTPNDPPVLGYIQTHKDKLRPILCNPLRTHILSGLAVEGLVKLDHENVLQSIELLTTMENFFIKRETEGQGVPTAERHHFYKLCLFGVLEDIRQFNDHHLRMFAVQDSAYISFLRRQTRLDKFANNTTFYHFEHEMLNEFFAARAMEALGKEMKAAIVLHLCSQKIFRNLQKLVFGILGEYGTESSVPLMVGMARLILLHQALSSYQRKPSQKNALGGSQNSRYKEWDAFVSNLQTLFGSISSTIPTPAAILQTQDGEDGLRDGDVTRIWDMVGTTFNQLTNLIKMNQSPYGEVFWVETYFSTGYDFVDLLSECTPQQQAEIADSSYLLMLPCYRVYPCGGRRWVNVDGNRICCWSPEDAVTGLLQHRRRGAHRGTTGTLYIDFTGTPSQWGRPPADCWTRAAWDSALQAAVEHYITDELWISLPATYSPPLQELLYSLTHLDMAHYPHRGIVIWYGTISLTALLQWYQESGVTHRREVTLSHTTLQLPADTHSRGLLLQGVGEGFVQDVRYYIVDKGLTGGKLDAPYPLTGGVTLCDPFITFM